MKRPKKKTFRRYCVIKGCQIDFGLGPGVIARDIVAFRDPNGRGFNCPLFGIRVQEEAEKMIFANVTVLADEATTWDKDPQATLRKNQKRKES